MPGSVPDHPPRKWPRLRRWYEKWIAWGRISAPTSAEDALRKAAGNITGPTS